MFIIIIIIICIIAIIVIIIICLYLYCCFPARVHPTWHRRSHVRYIVSAFGVFDTALMCVVCDVCYCTWYCTIHGTAHGMVRGIVNGIWYMVHGMWYVVCGMWYVVHSAAQCGTVFRATLRLVCIEMI